MDSHYCDKNGFASLLTPREKQVLSLLEQGCSNKAIASTLFVSLSTAMSHVEGLRRKFKVPSRGQVVALWVKENEKLPTPKMSGEVAVVPIPNVTEWVIFAGCLFVACSNSEVYHLSADDDFRDVLKTVGARSPSSIDVMVTSRFRYFWTLNKVRRVEIKEGLNG